MIGKRLLFAFLVALIFLIANAVVSFRATNTLIENNKRVAETLEVTKDVESTFSIVKDAETGQRGYLLTGNREFLQPYESAMQRIDARIQDLYRLTENDPELRAKIEPLTQAIMIRLRTLAENISIFESEGSVALKSKRLLERGKGEMDAIRTEIAAIMKIEDDRLAERLAESERSRRSAIFTFLIANALVIALLGLVYILVIRDLEERRRAQARLKEANDLLELRVKERTAELADTNTELERSNRELQDFAFVASHDLQEPLRKIQAFGDRLRTVQGPKFDDQGRDYLERMHSAAGRMHTLINDLLMYSRVTTKAQPYEPTDLNQIVKDVIGDLEVRIQETGGKIDAAALPTIDADPVQMRQLFQNLIANALKFHRADVAPVVKIEIVENFIDSDAPKRQSLESMVTIAVADNGIGFEERYLDRIFTPFQRLHGRNEYEGTGIGLAVCRKIAERHGGALTATSVPGSGSTFYITLPLNQDEEQKN